VPDRYSIEMRPAAFKALDKLPSDIAGRILDKIEQLATNPRPPGCKLLIGHDGEWRIRVGNYRIIYRIFEAELVVLTIAVAHRRDAYRD
jgi:mRNA interferase RelE/StbE